MILIWIQNQLCTSLHMTNLIYVDWLFIYAGAPYQISIGPKVQLVSVLLSISTLILSIPDYHGYSRSNNIHTLDSIIVNSIVLGMCVWIIFSESAYTRNIDSFIKLWRSVCSEHRGLGPPSLFYLFEQTRRLSEPRSKRASGN